MAAICRRNGVFVVADEIHCELTYPGHPYTPFASLSEDALRHSVTCISPSKAFNLAGIQIANIVAADEEVRKERLIEGRGYSEKKVREIMANQLSEDEFSSHCDFEIDNSGDFEETKKQLDHRMKKYETL